MVYNRVANQFCSDSKCFYYFENISSYDQISRVFHLKHLSFQRQVFWFYAIQLPDLVRIISVHKTIIEKIRSIVKMHNRSNVDSGVRFSCKERLLSCQQIL